MTATDLDPAALLDALHAALDADPSDAATRQALADLLQDTGDPAGARGQRWQALHGKAPAGAGWHGDGWRWWEQATARHTCDLPRTVFAALSGGRPYAALSFCRTYPTRRAAEADLAQALETSVSREARVAGYDGEPCPWCGERKQVSSGRERACDGCGRRWAA